MSERLLPIPAAQLRKFRRSLLSWYDVHARDLPWRRNPEPYGVWVSEIMLQQTRVAAVLEHYARFMRRFPDVNALARAREQSVLAAWSGLGYYHRARRMREAAKEIVKRGTFPSTAEEWRRLPGIGRYTAAAVASIGFGEPVAVVDGNVQRVVERTSGFAAGGEAVWQQAQAFLDTARPGDFNQAMMELGATVCTPRAPQCLLCPVYSHCATRGEGKGGSRQPRKSRELHYVYLQRNGSVLLVQRPADSSLMAGMWELPPIQPEDVDGARPLLRLKHSITDTDYGVTVLAGTDNAARQGKWFTCAQWRRLPLTGLARKILQRLVLCIGDRHSRI
jgi:A/G-specific adenine glycosylase